MAQEGSSSYPLVMMRIEMLEGLWHYDQTFTEVTGVPMLLVLEGTARMFKFA